MEPQRYLERIGYIGSLEPSPGVLHALHWAHMLNVPFENLDIAVKRPIILETERLLHKIVELRRGGFCYELNGAFSWLLRALGFRVRMLSARVARKDGTFGQEFDHMALEVEDATGECRLADVGFGDSFLEPLALTSSEDTIQMGWTYRLCEVDGAYLLQRRSAETDWTSQYQFTRMPHALEEFAPMCNYHQTSPESSFTQRRVCSLARSDGRITLEGNRFITTKDGKKTELAVTNEDEFREILKKEFGVEL